MIEIRSIVTGELTNALEEIRENMSSKGVNASGRTSASMRVEDRGDSIVLVMGGDRSVFGKTAPLETLQVGSKPGLRGSWFKSVIYNWTIDKDMTFENDSHRWAVSTLIAKKIEEQGTERHSHHIDVYSSVVNKTMDGIRSLLVADFKTMLHTMIKSV